MITGCRNIRGEIEMPRRYNYGTNRRPATEIILCHVSNFGCIDGQPSGREWVGGQSKGVWNLTDRTNHVWEPQGKWTHESSLLGSCQRGFQLSRDPTHTPKLVYRGIFASAMPQIKGKFHFSCQFRSAPKFHVVDQYGGGRGHDGVEMSGRRFDCQLLPARLL